MMYWKSFLCMTEELARDPFKRDWAAVFSLTFAYLRDEIEWTLFHKALCKALQATHADQRINGILDHWVTGLFYFRESSVLWWKRKRMRQLAYLCWSEVAVQLAALSESTEKPQPVLMEAMFDELRLIGCNNKIKQAQIANHVIALVTEFPQLYCLRMAVRQEGHTLFYQRYFPAKVLCHMALMAWGVMSAALFTACGILAYRILVLYPILELTADVQSRKRTQELIEVAYQGVAFFQNGLQVFSSRLTVWCCLVFFLLSLDALVDWISKRWTK